jgi:hypothetical protein
VEDHVLAHAEAVDEPHERMPIRLPVVPDKPRMGGADDEIDHIRVLRHDLRQGLDHVLDALPRREQPEREKHVGIGDSEAFLVGPRCGEWRVGNAVRYDVDAVACHTVNLLQEIAAAVRHHCHAGRKVQHLVHHAALLGRRLSQHGVERGVNGHRQFAKQVDDVAPRHAAEDAVLVLE